MVVGVVLAGGKSSRMGQDKAGLTLPDSNLSLLIHAKTLLECANLKAVLVSGDGFDIADDQKDIGPIGGIYSSLKYISRHFDKVSGAVFVPVDMPMLTPEMLTNLAHEGEQRACLCHYQSSVLPLYSPVSTNTLVSIKKQIRQQQYALKALLKTASSKQLSQPENNPFTNINTPNEWQDWLRASELTRGS